MYNLSNKSNEFYRMDLSRNVIVGPFDKVELRDRVMTEALDQNKVRCWNFTGKDTAVFTDWTKRYLDEAGKAIYPVSIQYTRPVVYYDGYNRIINPNDYLVDNGPNIDTWSYRTHECVPIKRKPSATSYYAYLRKMRNNYQFRMNPVPMTRKCRGGCGGSKRGNSFFRTWKLATDPDYGTYVRKKAVPFAFEPWADIYESRDCNRSWKKKKVRKQWMKNLKEEEQTTFKLNKQVSISDRWEDYDSDMYWKDIVDFDTWMNEDELEDDYWNEEKFDEDEFY